MKTTKTQRKKRLNKKEMKKRQLERGKQMIEEIERIMPFLYSVKLPTPVPFQMFGNSDRFMMDTVKIKERDNNDKNTKPEIYLESQDSSWYELSLDSDYADYENNKIKINLTSIEKVYKEVIKVWKKQCGQVFELKDIRND